MSEVDVNGEIPKRKVSKLANSSVVCVIIESFMLFLGYFLDFPTEYTSQLHKCFNDIYFIVYIALIFVTPILSIAALISISISKGLLAGDNRALITLLLSLAVLFLSMIM